MADDRIPWVREVQLPLASGVVVLRGTFPLSEADWKLLLKLLQKMKGGLVEARRG